MWQHVVKLSPLFMGMLLYTTATEIVIFKSPVKYIHTTEKLILSYHRKRYFEHPSAIGSHDVDVKIWAFRNWMGTQ